MLRSVLSRRSVKSTAAKPLRRSVVAFSTHSSSLFATGPVAVSRRSFHGIDDSLINLANCSYNAVPVYNSMTRSFSSDAVKTVDVPPMGDSITEGTIKEWVKGVGEYVEMDEVVVAIETDKIVVEIRAPEAGVIKGTFAEIDDTVAVGSELFSLDTSATSGSAPAKPAEKVAEPTPQPAAPTPAPTPTPTPTPTPSAAPAAPSQPAAQPTQSTGSAVGSGEHRVKMTRMRTRIAERLKDSQNTYAMLTTFNEVDMSQIIQMRKQLQDGFQKKHGIKLGFMSAFIKAAALALQNQPVMNAVIDNGEIVYRDNVDISVAVAAPNGLLVPVLRDCESKSFAQLEKDLVDLSSKAREGKITMEDMSGGTFTISNGGVYGSMMGTPIINPPQSAILGMHSIKDRAMVVNGQVEVRPVMYLALTYDHRLIDGREAVTFLKSICDSVADPRRILLEL